MYFRALKISSVVIVNGFCATKGKTHKCYYLYDMQVTGELIQYAQVLLVNKPVNWTRLAVNNTRKKLPRNDGLSFMLLVNQSGPSALVHCCETTSISSFLNCCIAV